MAAAVALIIAVCAGSTDAGVDRARHAALQFREVVMPSGIKPARPIDAVESRKLAETVRVLTADRERLIARIAALEHNVDDITSSISRAERTALPAAPPAELSPPPAEPSPPPMMSTAPQTTPPTKPSPMSTAPQAAPPTKPSPPPMRSTAPQTTPPRKPPEDDVTSSVGKPEAPPSKSETQTAPVNASPNPVTKRQFGLDLGGAPSEDALRALWTAALRRHGALIQDLRPVVLTREHPRGYRLIAGPIDDAAKAARFCAAITATGGVCQPAMYDGQRLAIR